MKKILTLIMFVTVFTLESFAQVTVSVKNATKHIGETVKICDKVFSGKLVPVSKITMLNIGSYGPAQGLSIIIPAADRAKFKGHPEIDYMGKDIIVTGKLVTCKGKPEIIIRDPKQLKVVLVDNARDPLLPVK